MWLKAGEISTVVYQGPVSVFDAGALVTAGDGLHNPIRGGELPSLGLWSMEVLALLDWMPFPILVDSLSPRMPCSPLLPQMPLLPLLPPPALMFLPPGVWLTTTAKRMGCSVSLACLNAHCMHYYLRKEWQRKSKKRRGDKESSLSEGKFRTYAHRTLDKSCPNTAFPLPFSLFYSSNQAVEKAICW